LARIVLTDLQAGGFGTTSSSTTTSAPTATVTTTTTTPLPALVAGPNGLGAISFGDDAEQALVVLQQLLGPPAGDSGWVVGGMGPGGPWECTDKYTRTVEWPGLRVEFTSVDTGFALKGSRHFAWYRIEAPGIPTDRGVEVGDTIEEASQAYRDYSLRYFDCSVTDDPGIGKDPFTGADPFSAFPTVWLDGDGPGSRVTAVQGGYWLCWTC
jgi:hypothetical protein